MGASDEFQFLPARFACWTYLMGVLTSCIKTREWLVAAQMNWTAPYENAETADKPFRRSMQFLRGVLEQFPNDTWVHRDRLLVRGMLGHFYEVRIDRGAHNAPFKIHGVGKKMTQRHSICILWENITVTSRLVIPLPSSYFLFSLM